MTSLFCCRCVDFTAAVSAADDDYDDDGEFDINDVDRRETDIIFFRFCPDGRRNNIQHWCGMETLEFAVDAQTHRWKWFGEHAPKRKNG